MERKVHVNRYAVDHVKVNHAAAVVVSQTSVVNEVLASIVKDVRPEIAAHAEYGEGETQREESRTPRQRRHLGPSRLRGRAGRARHGDARGQHDKSGEQEHAGHRLAQPPYAVEEAAGLGDANLLRGEEFNAAVEEAVIYGRND